MGFGGSGSSKDSDYRTYFLNSSEELQHQRTCMLSQGLPLPPPQGSHQQLRPRDGNHGRVLKSQKVCVGLGMCIPRFSVSKMVVTTLASLGSHA